ncbi:hypothetical protein [Streptomyces sp. H34-S4]|nr:hypothetical protein [Streptomyces sp. H34-S4]MCY0934101.1 hypothetical protein [Streptomyces sp. H34-S4]
MSTAVPSSADGSRGTGRPLRHSFPAFAPTRTAMYLPYALIL